MSVAQSQFATAETLLEQMRLPEAIDMYYLAEISGADPDLCSAARWTCFMLGGRWELAWDESDKIAHRGRIDPHRYWNGLSWDGKDVIIRCLHGLGDTLQFIRYAALIRKTSRTLTIQSQPKLKVLLQQSDLADTVSTWGEAEPEWQVQIEVNELPRIFRSCPNTIPRTVPYLKSSVHAGVQTGKSIHVGLIWAASDFDRTRNVPLDLLQPLLDLPGVTFFSLQAGEGWTENLPRGLQNLSARDTAIEQIADSMVALDLVVTVDTMNAHLAGALGCETWTLLPFRCDWRWMKDRRDTPWYPSMRLFRQPEPGNWKVVIDDVRCALAVRLLNCPADRATFGWAEYGQAE